jgi:trigger factor
MAQLIPIDEERAAEEGDAALIDFEGLKDGKPFSETQKTENFTVKIGEGKVLEDLESGIIGMIPGENREIKVKFPGDYFNKKLANLEIDFQVTLNQIRKEVLPEIDDELAKKTGQYQTLDELKQALTENMKDGYTKRVEQELNEQIFEALLKKQDFEVPEAMVEYELNSIVEEAERSFAYRNVSMEDMGLTKEGLADKYRDTAVKQVKRHLILAKLIEQENLELTDDELENGFAEMAGSMGQSADEVKGYYNQNVDKLDFFKHALLEKKAIKLIIDHSHIKTVAPKEDA